MDGSGRNADYREDPNRAVYLLGEINPGLVEKLTPQINVLRLSSATPITAYIDSQGGDVWAAENIRSLLQAPNPDGAKCRLITVVTGSAASVAADFLALGDYAIAYSHSYIMVSLCRILQSADYWFAPEEAYWLGLVDEVPGSDLPSQRQFVEGQTHTG